MADRIEISKLAEFVALGPPADSIAISKLAMFVILEPGIEDPSPSVGQGYVYSQRMPRTPSYADESDELGASDEFCLIWTDGT